MFLEVTGTKAPTLFLLRFYEESGTCRHQTRIQEKIFRACSYMALVFSFALALTSTQDFTCNTIHSNAKIANEAILALALTLLLTCFMTLFLASSYANLNAVWNAICTPHQWSPMKLDPHLYAMLILIPFFSFFWFFVVLQSFRGKETSLGLRLKTPTTQISSFQMKHLRVLKTGVGKCYTDLCVLVVKHNFL